VRQGLWLGAEQRLGPPLRARALGLFGVCFRSAPTSAAAKAPRATELRRSEHTAGEFQTRSAAGHKRLLAGRHENHCYPAGDRRRCSWVRADPAAADQRCAPDVRGSAYRTVMQRGHALRLGQRAQARRRYFGHCTMLGALADPALRRRRGNQSGPPWGGADASTITLAQANGATSNRRLLNGSHRPSPARHSYLREDLQHVAVRVAKENRAMAEGVISQR